MRILRLVRFALWAGLAVALIIFLIRIDRTDTLVRSGPDISIGGVFSLVDGAGRRVTSDDLRGHPSLIFFGFTHCPDTCPTTLYEAVGWLDSLGKEADAAQIVFISIDPDRDTPEIMASYVRDFSRPILALTGSRAELDRIKTGYRVKTRRVDLGEGEYTLDHTALVFLMDKQGRFVSTIAPDESREVALAKLRNLLAGLQD